MLAFVFVVAYIAASYAVFTAKYNVVFTTKEEEDRIAKQKRQALVDRIKPSLSIGELEDIVEANQDRLKACHYDVLDIAYGIKESEMNFGIQQTLGFILTEFKLVTSREDSFVLA